MKYFLTPKFAISLYNDQGTHGHSYQLCEAGQNAAQARQPGPGFAVYIIGDESSS